MHIRRIELENIKSHAAFSHEFGRGTTAITGENGAGKTTLIEAVAWVMFDLLEYKKEDFLRRGAKKGLARITFVSGLDEREYVVFRDTGTAWNVTDPRLGRKIADKREEVTRFLWQHLGLEPGTDLKSLFRQAIGVPQGTLTSIFLEGATERKIAFDKLLKVEEYRQAAEKLRETVRLVDYQIGSVREEIARAEGELARSPGVDSEHRASTRQAEELGTEIETLQSELAAIQESVKALDDQERQVAGLKTALEKSRADKEKAELVLKQATDAHNRSVEAASRIEGVRAAHENHLAALGTLKELEREREVRDRIRGEMAKTEAAIVNVKAEQKRLEQELKAIQDAHAEIEELRPKAAEQEALQKEIAELQEAAAAARTAEERIKSIEAELGRLREKYKQNRAQLTTAEQRSAGVDELATLESRDAEIVATLAMLRANLERDEKFQAEVRDGLCPILSERCLNLKEGQTLDAFLTSQFADTRSQISELEKRHTDLTASIAAAREAGQLAKALESYRQREEELKEDAAGLHAKKAELEARQRQLGASEQRQAELTAKLTQLADPAARIRVLEQTVTREPDVRQGLSDVESNFERLETERRILAEQLDEYRELDEKWARSAAARDETAEAHRQFLANEAEAAALAERERTKTEAVAAVESGAAELAAAERAYDAAGVDYDAERHASERARLIAAERSAAEVRTKLEATRARIEQLEAEIVRFGELRRALTDSFREKERLEKVAEATAFIRDTLKEAAPRVARNYVYHVSLEANQMFREITGNAERTLKWAEDYAIMLEEDGYERPFVSLSGGEQMAAALSIRLGLLKQLTDIRIAFFDEPTANLDAERRENLAQQISRITNFDQLFVISHDETFDSYVDNVIAL